ncbi:MAG TPA: hypothetical protein PK858_02470, partial [Saprospiraceae bacterium]|nr:hypothetical protein [Saprospiraceae bacterium]
PKHSVRKTIFDVIIRLLSLVAESMSRIFSIGGKRHISFWSALAFFAVAACYGEESHPGRTQISSLPHSQENLDMLLAS